MYRKAKLKLNDAINSPGNIDTEKIISAVDEFKEEVAQHDEELNEKAQALAPGLGYHSHEAEMFARVYKGRSVGEMYESMASIRKNVPALFE